MGNDAAPGELLDILDGELDRLGSLFPGLSFRFCRVMGRRVSHLTGSTSTGGTEELKLPVTPDLLLFVSGSWRRRRRELRKYADDLAGRIEGS
ncbi:MAG: hypothetical protein R6U39_04520 [Candidatus Aegiribacteria sp.]